MAEIRSDWPLAEVSQFHSVRPHRWHAQVLGQGPDVLFLHGTGASTHLWSGVMQTLAKRYRVIAVDLPGHGYTRLGSRHRSRPETMAADLWSLADHCEWEPFAIVGHSAGVALALHMADDVKRGAGVRHVVGVNAALDSFDGAAEWLFPVAARALTAAPGFSSAIARLGRDRARVARLLRSTGSQLGDGSIDCYRALFSDPGHVDGTFLMMAQWSTGAIRGKLVGWPGSLDLLSAENDATVSPSVSERAAGRAPSGLHRSLGAFGHLAHEEASEQVSAAIQTALER